MKERCIELAKQAGLKKDHASDREYMGDFDWRQYGELIVRECVSKIENEAAQYAEPVWAFELINDIKEHFGVKE
jgi:hypothetical protein